MKSSDVEYDEDEDEDDEEYGFGDTSALQDL